MKPVKSRLFFALAVTTALASSAFGLSLFAQVAGDNNNGADLGPKAPILARTAAEEARSFVLPAGYRMELVLSDPDIVNPVVTEFDGNGRMYVVEFVTYMPDVEGNHQREPRNRISRWEDTDGDGKYDKHSVFADNLVLPRMVLPLDKDSILTNETDSDDVIKLTDTNGDGVADKREVFFSGVGLNRDGNLEHMQSGFVWGLDNWIYSTYNAFRFRWTPGGILREPTGNNGGQWGLTQDDDGKMWFVCAGCERGPLNFQVPIQYGAYRATDEYEPGFDIVWPITGLGDMQGGMGRVRTPIGVVNHATATAGPDIVRAHRLPKDLQGDLLYAEPVGRLIRRAKIVKTEGLTQVKNAYPGSEFILSTDPLFRPVNLKTAPDGTVYISDMYRGIIQEAQWTGPGSYLRMKILQYQLDKITSHGRIWRLRYDGTAEVPGTPVGPAASRAIPAVPATPALTLDATRPRMLNESASELVAHLNHPNGWWRDSAQRLLVLKQDKSVVPALQTMARSSDDLVARFHALWTLEGLNALDAVLVRDLLKDPNPRMRVQAIRASETLYKAGNKSFDADYRTAAKDTDADVAIQALMTLKVLRVADYADVINATMTANKARGVQELGKLAVAPPAAGAGRGGPPLPADQQQLFDRGQAIYGEICFSCHGEDGRGTPKTGEAPGATMAPPLAGSAHVQGHRDFVIRTLLHGLVGPNNGRTYTEVMIPMGTQKDDWIASVGSYVRNSFGNTASFITPADVARVRAATASRKTSWTVEENEGLLPLLLQTQPTWKTMASRNVETSSRGLTLVGWNTGTPTTGTPAPGTPAPTAPAPGPMWWQVELPDAVVLSEVQFNAPAIGRAGGPGPAGAGPAAGGAAPATPAAAPPAPPPAPAAAASGRGAGRGQPAAAPPPDVQVQVSMDGKTWSAPLAGAPTGTLSILAFTPTRAKFVRLTRNTPMPNNAAWTVQNVRLFQAAAAPPGSR